MLAIEWLNNARNVMNNIEETQLENIRKAAEAVSYTHLRAHETPEHLVCRLLLEKNNKNTKLQHHVTTIINYIQKQK